MPLPELRHAKLLDWLAVMAKLKLTSPLVLPVSKEPTQPTLDRDRRLLSDCMVLLRKEELAMLE